MVAQPFLFADFTTEGGASPKYFYNYAKYSSFAAWLTAVSGTFSRSSSKYVTNSSGNLVQISSGVVPFDYSPSSVGTSNGLLLEGASTNVCTYSNTFSNAVWLNAGGSGAVMTKTQNATGPDGTTSAWTIQAGSGTNIWAVEQNISIGASGTPFSISGYVAAGTSRYIYVTYSDGGGSGNHYITAVFDLGAGAGNATQTAIGGSGNVLYTATLKAAPNGMLRFYLSGVLTYSVAGFFDIGLAGAATGNSFNGFGQPSITATGTQNFVLADVQAEALAPVTSYIPTTSSSATRSADVLTVPWTATTATFVLNTLNMIYAGSQQELISANSASDQPLVMYDAASIYTYQSSGATLYTSPVISSWASSNISGVSGSNSARAITANNLAAATDGNALFQSAPSDIWIGSFQGGASLPAFGNFSSFGAWTVALSTSDLQTVTGSSYYPPDPYSLMHPFLFADFTTEGGAPPRYFYGNNTPYTSFAAWLTAVSGTFSRSSAKYVTNSSGNLVQISSGVVPFDYSPTSVGTLNGLLMEGASANLVYPSQGAFNGSQWTKYRTTIVDNNVVAPDGTTTASTMTGGANGNSQYQVLNQKNAATITSGVPFTFSVYAKAGTSSKFSLAVWDTSTSNKWVAAVFDLSAGAGTATQTAHGTTSGTVLATSITAAANGFWRLSLTGSMASTAVFQTLQQAAAATGNTFDTYGDANSAPQSLTSIFWGAQFENLPFASSYIPTTSSSATRAADVLELPWTSAEATFVIKSLNQNYSAGASADLLAANTNSNGDILLGMGSGTSLVTIDSAATLTQSAAVASWAASNICGVAGNPSGRVLTANNETPTSDSNLLFTATPADIWIGGGNAAAPAYGDISSFEAWTGALTPSDLQAVTGGSYYPGGQYSLSLTDGSFSITGVAITFKRAVRIASLAGSYILSGASITIKSTLHYTILSGSYIMTGGLPDAVEQIPTFIRNATPSLAKIRSAIASLTQ